MRSQATIHDVLETLRARYPSRGALEIGTPYHMLVMVVLSARTRDEQVLKLAPEFFSAFPTPQDLAVGDIRVIEQKLATIGLFRAKAKNVKALAEKLVSDFDGEVPRTMDELVSLPGVGRKTASVVLAAAFGVPAIAVDVHVHRIANRLGWVKTKTPEQTERALLKIVAPEDRATVNLTFVPFGRGACTPGTPRCYMCPLADVCAFPKKNLETPKNVDKIVDGIARQQAVLAGLRDNAEKAIG